MQGSTVNSLLLAYLEHRNLTPKALREATGLSRQQTQRLLSGATTQPGLLTLKAIREGFVLIGVPLSSDEWQALLHAAGRAEVTPASSDLVSPENGIQWKYPDRNAIFVTFPSARPFPTEWDQHICRLLEETATTASYFVGDVPPAITRPPSFYKALAKMGLVDVAEVRAWITQHTKLQRRYWQPTAPEGTDRPPIQHIYSRSAMADYIVNPSSVWRTPWGKSRRSGGFDGEDGLTSNDVKWHVLLILRWLDSMSSFDVGLAEHPLPGTWMVLGDRHVLIQYQETFGFQKGPIIHGEAKTGAEVADLYRRQITQIWEGDCAIKGEAVKSWLKVQMSQMPT